MENTLLLRGLSIGFAIAAPVGPIGILCIRQTIAFGWLHGFVVGLGAATADALYGFVAGFGLTFITSFLIEQQTWLRSIGGIFLCYLGIKTFTSIPAQTAASTTGSSLASTYTSTFALTLTNPATILAFAAIFSGLGLGKTEGNYFSALLLVAGVFCGSMLWWLLLSGTIVLVQTKLNLVDLKWVNRLSGIVITGFGIVALLMK